MEPVGPKQRRLSAWRAHTTASRREQSCLRRSASAARRCPDGQAVRARSPLPAKERTPTRLDRAEIRRAASRTRQPHWAALRERLWFGSVLTRDFHFARRIRAFIHQHASPHARFLQRTLFRSQLPSGGAALDGKPTGAPAFRVFLRHRSTRVPCLRRFVALRPRVSLLAPAAPRSSAACRRTAAGSDAPLPAGASSTAHASPAGPRFSLAAAGDSSATSA